MTAVTLLESLKQAGLTLRALDNNTIRVEPANALTESTRELIKQHKAELLSLLRAQAASEPLVTGALTEAQAEQLTTEQILGYTPEDLAELDRLINRLCDLVHYSAEARERILDARKRMRPAVIHAELAYFREQVRLAQNGEFRWN